MTDVNSWQMPTYFTKDKYERLKYKFNGSENIQHNFSQCYQDMFVLTCLDGKREGTYVEIGSGHPFISNNTALLELEFGWKGVSLEIKEYESNLFNSERKNIVAQGDATIVDYEDLFNVTKLGPHFDFLQVDCEPASITFKALKKIPLDKYSFSVIIFEHDFYNHKDETSENSKVRDASRKYLKKYGYELVVNNISVDDSHPFEDWWVNPNYINEETISKLKSVNVKTKKAENYLLDL